MITVLRALARALTTASPRPGLQPATLTFFSSSGPEKEARKC